jgi:hypothetical protein
MRAIIDALVAALRRPLLISILLVGNIALFGVFYAWLSIPERTTAVLAASLIVLLAVVFGALWLYAMSLAAFHEAGGRAYVVIALRRLPRFLPWAILMAAAIYWAGWFAPLAFLVLLPAASQASGGRFGGGWAKRIFFRPRYWLGGVLALLVGVLVPKLLVSWVPKVSGVTAQSASLVARFGLALLLAALAWLMLAALIGRMGREPAN